MRETSTSLALPIPFLCSLTSSLFFFHLFDNCLRIHRLLSFRNWLVNREAISVILPNCVDEWLHCYRQSILFGHASHLHLTGRRILTWRHRIVREATPPLETLRKTLRNLQGAYGVACEQ
ncbi:hypothetical protein F4775DRAFT_531133 [Biscogniauxia sp. FL1348]|nr:hypothetical protein F4775DRAFT_531133 [Biscogniauxia sp. FL1348]